ncbi:DUF317 domain-containing protein [Streptomyces sp. CB03238]|uniref:DUF317 domain-containing protein n=1 Tax=Streptomyces sp. CB03238 TaxID=1907777 RepID=UPI000A1181E2|nr:DUF317 domain-containing protein [Streptomyces sp. CB03238]ORT59165.1 hypothetical protein BKD26_14225 [Streptomyces sp. CB03238]
MTLSVTAPSHVPAAPRHSALGDREWLLDCHCAGPVIDLLKGQGWDVIPDLSANVHCSSPDQRVYVGFLPETEEAARGELWHIQVKGADGRVAWSQTFGSSVPAQAVAGFLAALIAFPSRCCACV